MTETRIRSCPSPDNCPFETDDVSELAAHINTEHASEYQRMDWPDTEAGRITRAHRFVADEDEE